MFGLRAMILTHVSVEVEFVTLITTNTEIRFLQDNNKHRVSTVDRK